MRSFIRITALLFTLSAAANAQYTIKKIVFDGQNLYSQTELEAASGLKPGQTLNNEALQAAAQRLVDTGAFEDMQATLDGPMKAISVIFKVKPVETSKLLHISYVNFAWWSPEELKAEINRRVPLTGETVPEAGSLQASVQTALEAMLREKGLAGAKVSEEVLEPRPGTPFRVAAYRIESPAVMMGSVRVDGVSPAMQASVQKMTASLAGRPYNEDVGGQDISASLLAIFRDAGYLTAKLSPLQHDQRNRTGAGLAVDHGTSGRGIQARNSLVDWSSLDDRATVLSRRKTAARFNSFAARVAKRTGNNSEQLSSAWLS